MRRLNVVILLLVVTIRVMSQVNIWEGVSHHKKVMMTPYLANSDGKSIAIIVCPGGSYLWNIGIRPKLPYCIRSCFYHPLSLSVSREPLS